MPTWTTTVVSNPERLEPFGLLGRGSFGQAEQAEGSPFGDGELLDGAVLVARRATVGSLAFAGSSGGGRRAFVADGLGLGVDRRQHQLAVDVIEPDP